MPFEISHRVKIMTDFPVGKISIRLTLELAPFGKSYTKFGYIIKQINRTQHLIMEDKSKTPDIHPEKSHTISFTSLHDFEIQYQNTPQYQMELSNYMLRQFLADKELVRYRNFIKDNRLGMGEDEFMILWDLIVKSMPSKFSFCEIGVHKGQILALIELLSGRHKKKSTILGISPMNGANTIYTGDFKKEMSELYAQFNLEKKFKILEGFSQDKGVISKAAELAPFHILYIDGSHKTEDVQSDFDNYLVMLRKGGVLVVDDSNNNSPCTYGPPFKSGGRFWGIQEVSDVTDKVLNNNSDFAYIGSIIHNRVWKKLV